VKPKDQAMIIMTKIKIIAAIIFIISLMTTVILIKELIKSNKSFNRIELAIQEQRNLISYYKTENGKIAAKSDVILLRVKELKILFPQVISEIENLKIKTSRVADFSETIIKQENEIKFKLIDSIIYDTINIKKFEYSDEYYQVDGRIMNDSLRLNINSIDSIIQVIYWGKRQKPWLWILSKRNLEQAITNKNPKAKILYSKHIKIN